MPWYISPWRGESDPPPPPNYVHPASHPTFVAPALITAIPNCFTISVYCYFSVMYALLLMFVAALLAVTSPGSATVLWVVDHLVPISSVILLYCVAPTVLSYLTE